MQMNMTLETSSQEVQMTIRGAFNRSARKARTTTTVRGQEVRSYVDGTTMYVETRQGWQSRDLSDREPWNASLALERQRAIMDNANITEVGEATVNGTPVYVVEVEPKPERVKQVVARQQNRQLQGVSIEDVTYTQYVNRDTGRLVRAEMTMTMTANGQSVDVAATMTFSGYDEPTDVTIPGEARQSSVAPAA